MSIKDKVLEQLEQHKGLYISGGQLAKNLSVSRNAIWKAIKSLQKAGYHIDAISHRGYCLCADSDILSKQSISQYLKYDLNIEVKESVTSTNDVLKQLAEEGASNGTVIVSKEQTNGRGRMGKSFHSPAKTGIYFSILLRPNIPASESLFLTTSAAVSVAKAIEDVSDNKADIKWVNDIYIKGKKVCGILTEAVFNIETNKLDYAIVGIGINVCPPTNHFPKDIRNIATSVFQNQSDSLHKRSLLIANVLNYFMDYYENFEKKSYINEYISRSIIVGKNIKIIEQDKEIDALALKIDRNCRLKIRLADGAEKWLNCGEVSIKL